MVVRMRHTHGHTGNRRSHHALKERVFSVCECGSPRLPHAACPQCGRYRGRIVVDLIRKAEVRAARRAERLRKEGRPTPKDKREG